MEWRDVPGFPGYQVSERGKLRKASGYELGRRGTRYVLSRGGVRVRLTTQELIALAWAPVKSRVAAHSVTAPAAPAHAEKHGRDIPEGFVPVPGFNGYCINRKGVCIGPSGKTLTPTGRECHTPCYSLGTARRTTRTVAALLDLTFGAGAAVAAGYKAPNAEARRVDEIGPLPNGKKRRCHDCGKPTNNYRCNACWARLRGLEAQDAGEWNAL